LLPRALLSSSVGLREVEVVPRYLGPRDEPWLRALVDVYAAFEGQRRTALHDRLAEPLPVRAPRSSLRAARHVLDHVTKSKTTLAVPAEAARAAVFSRAAVEPHRERALALAAAELEVDPDSLEELLFADLRSSERVGGLPKDLSPAALAQRVNLAIASGLVQRAQSVRLCAFGNTRALVRHARLVGLICNCSKLEGGVELQISGPFALFRHTLIYGKRLASLVPRLMWCDRFELEAKVALGLGPALLTYRLRTGDPLTVGRELERYDSEVEARFARDFAKLASDWDLVREPEPLPLGSGRLIFPDFALVHRRDPERRWLLEIVGFWTESYLTDKLARLREARIDRLILCVDAARACDHDAVPEGAEVLRYRRRVDAKQVLARIEAAREA
jgi:predicted nuclease of restriction endonuclease-like RecB superfamily